MHRLCNLCKKKVVEENIKGKGKQIIQAVLNVSSPVASTLLDINPAFLSIPIIASVCNELCVYFDAKSVEKRLLQQASINQNTVREWFLRLAKN